MSYTVRYSFSSSTFLADCDNGISTVPLACCAAQRTVHDVAVVMQEDEAPNITLGPQASIVYFGVCCRLQRWNFLEGWLGNGFRNHGLVTVNCLGLDLFTLKRAVLLA
jgi:hypothetical protein